MNRPGRTRAGSFVSKKVVHPALEVFASPSSALRVFWKKRYQGFVRIFSVGFIIKIAGKVLACNKKASIPISWFSVKIQTMI